MFGHRRRGVHVAPRPKAQQPPMQDTDMCAVRAAPASFSCSNHQEARTTDSDAKGCERHTLDIGHAQALRLAEIGHQNPFCLTLKLIHTVMGAREAGCGSADLYMDRYTLNYGDGDQWSDQLGRRAKRACQWAGQSSAKRFVV